MHSCALQRQVCARFWRGDRTSEPIIMLANASACLNWPSAAAAWACWAGGTGARQCTLASALPPARNRQPWELADDASAAAGIWITCTYMPALVSMCQGHDHVKSRFQNFRRVKHRLQEPLPADCSPGSLQNASAGKVSAAAGNVMTCTQRQPWERMMPSGCTQRQAIRIPVCTSRGQVCNGATQASEMQTAHEGVRTAKGSRTVRTHAGTQL